MQGDFSVLNFDPYQHTRGVSPARNGVLRNINGVLHQQGRVTLDADLTEGELLDAAWDDQAGRDIIGAGIAAVPAAEPNGFRIDAAIVTSNTEVQLLVRPGRIWADGILTRLAGDIANPGTAVVRIATYFGPPLSDPTPTTDSINDGVRDAVILEVSEEAIHGFQYPDRLIEPALGGPDTSERSYVNYRLRLLRLGRDEDCTTILGKLADDPATKGKLSVTLAPPVVINGDCPVVGGGGYTGFEHFLYRIEIAETNGPGRFKWSQWNGGLAGRGRFDATVTPPKVVIDAGRAAIVSSGLAEFYLEALQYDDLAGAWRVIYGTAATLNSDHDLELAAPPAFGALPSTADPVFFRLWNGLEDISDFTNAGTPQELKDGIRLVFDAPAAGNYRPGDYWTFPVRAGEIANAPVLLDHAPPIGIAYHRVPLAEINWTGRKNTTIDGSIEDCRKRFRPLTNQKICCTYLIGDGVSTFGDFDSLEEAAAHLPASGGELCLLPGFHRANLVLTARRQITIHGCDRRTVVIPRATGSPIVKIVDCTDIQVRNLDLITFDGTPVLAEGTKGDSCRGLRIEHTRMIARINAIRANSVADLAIANNRLHLLDTVDGLATISIAADDALIERNMLVMMPFVEPPPGGGDENPDDPPGDPADPCAPPVILYARPRLVLDYAAKVFTSGVAPLAAATLPFRGLGGIHVRAGSERVRILENTIVGGAGNGVTLGGDIDPAPPVIILSPPAPPAVATLSSNAAAVASFVAGTSRVSARFADQRERKTVPVTVGAKGQFLALVQDTSGKPVADVDLYLDGPMTASDRSDARGMVSIKATSGAYELDVAPAFEILNVKESRDEGVVLNVVTVGPNTVTTAAASSTAFLLEITIQENDISLMGLSGIGFALLEGAVLQGAPAAPAANGAKAALIADGHRLARGVALAPLFRAATPVRDLVIDRNRLHQNLQGPFTDQMRAEAQQFGRGGISLAMVDTAVIAGNHVNGNGVSGNDPVCGVFVGYANNLDIAANLVSSNGPVGGDYEQNGRGGIRGGVFVQFAGALSTDTTVAIAQVPAVRVHDNRIDQPAGRALTVKAFGPVSCSRNHCNSERTGISAGNDLLFGCALVNNLADAQAAVASDSSSLAGAAAPPPAFLPGGETIVTGNVFRLGPLNRSLTSVGVAGFDIDFSSNQAASFRPGTYVANVFIVGDSVRATSGRFIEISRDALSLFTQATQMNTTALNQGNNCIVAQPPVVPGNVLPTVAAPNQVLNNATCANRFGTAAGIGEHIAQAISTEANHFGGTLAPDAFTSVELRSLARQLVAEAFAAVAETLVARTRAYQAETERLASKLGADHPRVAAMRAQADAGVTIAKFAAVTAEAITVDPPTPTETGASISGRVINDRGQGQPGLVVELVRADDTRVAPAGRTDDTGFFSQTFDERTTAALQKEGALFVHVLDSTGKEILFSKDKITIVPGANVQVTLTIATRVVPRSVSSTGKVIFDKDENLRTEPPAAVEPEPPADERPSRKRPARPRRKKE
jgi:hypothetical protein